MKNLKVLMLFAALCYSFSCMSQTYTYDQVVNKKIASFEPGTAIIVTRVSTANAASLTMESNGGDNVDGVYKGETKTFSIPADCQSLTIKTSAQNQYTINIADDSAISSASVADGTIYTNIAYWDAFSIYTILKTTGNEDTKMDKILKIINRYSGSNYSKISDLNGNPFFKQFFASNSSTNFIGKENMDNVIGTLHSSGGNPIGGVLGGTDVTRYVQGFADFLIERMKGEITLAYIDKLKKQFDKNEELKYLLPKTYQVFNNGDPFSIPTMGKIYKSAFAEDLQNLLLNFENMAYTYKRYGSLQTDNKFIAFMISYHFVDYSAKGYHPSEILTLLNDKYGFGTLARKSKADTISYSLSALTMLSENLRAQSKDDEWISAKELNLANPGFMLIFAGLLYEKYPDIMKMGTPLYTLFASSATGNANAVAQKLHNFLIIANNIDGRLKELKPLKASSSISPDETLNSFLNNADDILNLLTYSIQILQPKFQPDSNYMKLRQTLKQSIEVAKGINSNDLGKVTTNSVSLIATLLDYNVNFQTINDSLIALNKSLDSLLKNKLDTSSVQKQIRSFKRYLVRNKQIGNLIQNLTYYTNFISDMASTDSAKQVTDVLKKYAEPVKSYRVARQSGNSFSLQAFPGVYYGLENLKAEGRSNWSNAFGVTGPIGFSFSIGNSLKPTTVLSRKPYSLSLFLGLVDIGAALSYRFNNDETDLPDKITLAQIFSPGLHLVYGLANSPLAIKAGWQYSPELRSITTDGNETTEYGASRFSIGMTVDIPILIFSRKTY